jgi:guanine deaminase
VIRAAGTYPQIAAEAPGLPVTDHRPHLMMAGFIDPHIHFPQVQVIASWGAQLLDWLNTCTFPEEVRFADPAHCARMAALFLDQLAAHGTATAVAYASAHRASAEALFSEAARRDMRIIAGKVMMDRNAPEGLRDTPQAGYDDSKALIDRWHGRGRALYAITPRFAITSTAEQLEMAGSLVTEHPTCYLQTHLSETHGEIAVMQETGARRVFCPTSNLFLGSGLFDDAGLRGAGLVNAIATDVGGGTGYSMLQTLAEGYKVLQLRGQRLHPLRAFHWITRGNAVALGLEGRIGTLEAGTEADIVVRGACATPAEELFILQITGDDRAVAQTYIAGAAQEADSAPPP